MMSPQPPKNAIKAAMGPFALAYATSAGHAVAAMLTGDWTLAEQSEYTMRSEYALLIHRIPDLHGAINELDYYQGDHQ